jgi:hypothetical protein
MGRAGIAGAAGAAIAALLAVVLLIVGIGSSTQAISGASAGMACAPDGWTPGQPLEGFGPRELANAGAIVQVGAEMGMPQRAQVIAVATAARESRLLVLGNPTVAGSMQPPPQGVGHDHDSVGLFQQRGTGWGPLAVRMDPRGSARLFYERLRQVPGWERLPLTQAADAVQHSALPTRTSSGSPPPAGSSVRSAVSRADPRRARGRRRTVRSPRRSPPELCRRSASRTCGAAVTRKGPRRERPGSARRRAAGSTARD